MGQDEAQFSVEMPLTGKAYLWADKYRPRKPRFFNRVHTGFEWNKYNQTHYDFDNPPPKIVQGYKFNIFYPDLIDKRSTPEYFLEACPDNKDFATLRFHAGPALRGHCLQDRQPRVGVLTPPWLPLPVRQWHLPALVPLQALPLPAVMALHPQTTWREWRGLSLPWLVQRLGLPLPGLTFSARTASNSQWSCLCEQ